MRINAYTIQYRNGHIISHYELDELVKMVNHYNAIHYPNVNMSLTKMRRYSGNNSNIPFPYKNIDKIRLNEFLGVKNLSKINYGREWRGHPAYPNRQLGDPIEQIRNF